MEHVRDYVMERQAAIKENLDRIRADLGSLCTSNGNPGKIARLMARGSQHQAEYDAYCWVHSLLLEVANKREDQQKAALVTRQREIMGLSDPSSMGFDFYRILGRALYDVRRVASSRA